MYEERFYRNYVDFIEVFSFEITYKYSNILVMIDKKNYVPAMKRFLAEQQAILYTEIEEYIKYDQEFGRTFQAYEAAPMVSGIVRTMSDASLTVGVGPMASVAGAISQYLGRILLQKYNVNKLIVENGGDIYLYSEEDFKVGIYAGEGSSFNHLILKIKGNSKPIGICTSSGKIGHSVSMGSADAVTVICESASVSDAYATLLGNCISSKEDIKKVIDMALEIKEILGAVCICENKIGMFGCIEIVDMQL